jgi:hypothetical protein
MKFLDVGCNDWTAANKLFRSGLNRSPISPTTFSYFLTIWATRALSRFAHAWLRAWVYRGNSILPPSSLRLAAHTLKQIYDVIGWVRPNNQEWNSTPRLVKSYEIPKKYYTSVRQITEPNDKSLCTINSHS